MNCSTQKDKDKVESTALLQIEALQLSSCAIVSEGEENMQFKLVSTSTNGCLTD
jgi:hypothetical protein